MVRVMYDSYTIRLQGVLDPANPLLLDLDLGVFVLFFPSLKLPRSRVEGRLHLPAGLQ